MDGRAKKKKKARLRRMSIAEMQTQTGCALRKRQTFKYEPKKFQMQNGIADKKGIAGKWGAYGMQIGLPGWREMEIEVGSETDRQIDGDRQRETNRLT